MSQEDDIEDGKPDTGSGLSLSISERAKSVSYVSVCFLPKPVVFQFLDAAQDRALKIPRFSSQAEGLFESRCF